MQEIILIKNGELALKGLNRSTFESVLVKNIKRRMQGLGAFVISRSQSTITIEPTAEDFDMDEAVERLSKVFGIAGFQRAAAVEKDMSAILPAAKEYLADTLSEISTFKVEAKRSDKNFPFTSPEISREVGGALLSAFPHLKVDVHNPDCVVTVEVREKKAYIRCNQIKGAGGMPVGTGGKAALLISGGIDSPVAGWMMAKRGIVLDAVHFASPPFTSPQAEMKVHDLLRQVAKYSGDIGLYTVPFTEIQTQIRDNCPEELFTLIMRRFMMRISERIARRSLRAKASGRWQARRCSPWAVPTRWSGFPCSARLSGWTKMKSLSAHGRLIPLIFPFSRMRTAVRYSPRSTRKRARKFRFWSTPKARSMWKRLWNARSRAHGLN